MSTIHNAVEKGRKSLGSYNECTVNYADGVVTNPLGGGAPERAVGDTSIAHWPRVCRICDVPFVADHPRRYLCSDVCLSESRRRNRVVRQATYRMRHPDKDRCRQTIKNLIQTGVIRRPARCELCGKRTSRIEAHHSDYTKPFYVQWVCDACHTALEIVWAEGAGERRAITSTLRNVRAR